MIVYIWSGIGILVAPIAFSSLIFAIFSSALFSSDPKYINSNPLLIGVWLIVAGVTCWFLDSGPRILGNLFKPRSEARASLVTENSFFFIPMWAWGPILGAIGLVLIVGNILFRSLIPPEQVVHSTTILFAAFS